MTIIVDVTQCACCRSLGLIQTLFKYQGPYTRGAVRHGRVMQDERQVITV